MLRARPRVLLSLALLFPLAASTPLACCAGAIDVHPSGATAMTSSHCGGAQGESCCDRAAEDAVARHCCQGGDAFERSDGAAPVPALDAATSAAGSHSAIPHGSLALLSATPDPVPRSEPLYTLHSCLLI